MKITQLNIKIIEEFTKDLTRKWSIYELAKSINKHYRPVYASVQSLIKEEVLTKNQNNLIEPSFKDTTLLELAEKERKLNKDVKIVKSKFSKIDSVFFSAVLFGSSVKKTERDIDILIIIPKSEDILSFKKEVEKELGSFYSKIDLNIVTEESCYEMLNKPNQLNVMNEIMKNHIVLIGTESFYNIIKKWKYG